MNNTIKIRRKLLRKARKLIEQRESGYVCIAVSIASNSTNNDEHAFSIRRHITSLLGGAPTLCCWYRQQQRVKIVNREYDGRLHRLAWIDHMLKTDPFFGGKP